MPMPSCASGTSSPVTPSSASAFHSSGERPVSVSQKARTRDAGTLAGEEIAQRLLQEQLIFVETEAHQDPFGRPRMRSAIRLRWISLVPA